MTDKQIANWRKMLISQFGAYATIMPVSQIIEIRDNMQKQVDDIDSKDNKDKEPEKFDPKNNWFQKALNKK